MTPTSVTRHQHHFEDLSFDDFERLVHWLVKRSGEFDEVQWYGGARDRGRDVVAYKHAPAGREKWYIQCKRYKKITFVTLRDELDKLAEHAREKPDFAPAVIIFATACPVPPQAKDQAADRAGALGLPEPYYWGRLELDERIKAQPETEREFFGQQVLPIDAPFQAPPLPRHFVPRSEVSNLLKARLLTDEAAVPGVLVVSAIHGLGGIAKSVLTAALTRDPEIQQCFSDGVLCCSFPPGSDPSLVGGAGWPQFPPLPCPLFPPGPICRPLCSASCPSRSGWTGSHRRNPPHHPGRGLLVAVRLEPLILLRGTEATNDRSIPAQTLSEALVKVLELPSEEKDI